jgi:spermidine synthase
LGALAAGWWLFDWLGTAGTLKLLVGMTSLFPLGAVALAGSARSKVAPLLAVAAGLAVAVALPGTRATWQYLHGADRDLIVREDGSGTSAIRRVGEPEREGAVIYVNGLGQSWMPYGGVHTTLGALPAFLHRDPREALVIGLGSGDTVFGVAGRPTLERIVAIEIVRPQLATLRDLAGMWAYPGLTSLLSDPRIEHVYGDGRLYLAQTARRFDIIEADALRPTSAYAGHLYSDGYFRLLRSRLKPGGMAVTWSPTERVYATFATVFPYVVRFGEILVGSNENIDVDPAAVTERVTDERVQNYFRPAGVDITALIATAVRSPRRLGPNDDRSGFTDINTDLLPKDEFGVRLR